jgi:hypothetical protein
LVGLGPVFEVVQYSVHDCGVLDAGDHLDGAGEGVYGLRRALVLAGAESQVMSLWKVDDQATKHLMVEYYRRLCQAKGVHRRCAKYNLLCSIASVGAILTIGLALFRRVNGPALKASRPWHSRRHISQPLFTSALMVHTICNWLFGIAHRGFEVKGSHDTRPASLSS